VVLRFTKRPVEAEAHYQRTVEIRAALMRTPPGDARSQARLAETYQNLGELWMHDASRREEAAAAYAKAESLLRPLVDQHPEAPEYALSLASVYNNWSYILKDTGRPQSALPLLGQAIDLAEAVLRLEPRHMVARYRVYTTHGTRALVHEQLGHYTEAVRDWDRVIELSSEPDRTTQRAIRSGDLARAGEHGRASAEAKALAETPSVSNEILYHLAGVYALADVVARSDERLPSVERAATAERYAAAAIALLSRLKGAGYFQSAERLKELRTDPDLQPLRERAEFQKMLPK
jgi:tetratricopeptide (TPR) repeat protein